MGATRPALTEAAFLDYVAAMRDEGGATSRGMEARFGRPHVILKMISTLRAHGKLVSVKDGRTNQVRYFKVDRGEALCALYCPPMTKPIKGTRRIKEQHGTWSGRRSVKHVGASPLVRA